MKQDRQNGTVYMRLALRLAEEARGRTSPNPMVGAVLVKDGRVIGQGYHSRAGAPHAEIEALRAASESPAGATMYVTLEPCCIHGKTPPCTDAIIGAGIQRVVAAMVDPNPNISAQGFQQLRAAGISVEVGLLEAEARRLNEAFIKHQTTGWPFVTAKYAMSLDGKIATKTGESKYLTNEASRAYVHQLRDQVDAIMVGVGTIRADDPCLTTRLADQPGHSPHRVILDTHLSLPVTAHVVTDLDDAPTTVFTCPTVNQQKVQQLCDRGVHVQPVACQTDGRLDLHQVLSYLGQAEIMSVLLEGGAEVHGTALLGRFVDKVLVFVAPLIIGGKTARSPVEGEGIAALHDALRLREVTTQRFDNDLLIEGYLDVHRNY